MEQIQHHEDYFEGVDDLQLFEQWWRPANPQAGVIIVHGLAEHSTRHTAFASSLASQGVAVYTFDLRGHGQSDGDRTYVQSFRDYLSDLAIFLSLVQDREPDLPLFLFGHSLGGAIATLFVIRYQPYVHGLLLSAPAIKTGSSIPPLLVRLSGLVGRVAPKLPTIKLETSAISRDPQVVKAYEQDPLVYRGGVLARTGAETNRAINEIQSRMEEITLPLLIMHGTADRLTEVEGSQQLYARAESKDKQLKLYEGLYHEILNEPEKEQVLGDIWDWLQKRAATFHS
jgi:acylglycerol lipase